jgi:hypothetical protein
MLILLTVKRYQRTVRSKQLFHPHLHQGVSIQGFRLFHETLWSPLSKRFLKVILCYSIYVVYTFLALREVCLFILCQLFYPIDTFR